MANAFASNVLQELEATRDEEETECARRFIRLLGVQGADIRKRERPDFTVNFGAASAALEVTRYYGDIGEAGSEEARFFKIWRAFAEELRASLAVAGLDHIYGAIHFREKSRTGVPDRDRLILEITDAAGAAGTSGALAEVGSLEGFDPHTQPALSAHVEYIYLRNATPERGVLWWCSHLQAGSVPDPEAGLRERVRAKDIAANKYQWPASDERWLLIYATARGLSDMARLEGAIEPSISSAEFDRVFLYDAFGQRMHQLHPEFALIRDGRDLFVRQLPAIVPGALAG